MAAKKFQGFPVKLAGLMAQRHTNQSDLAKIIGMSKTAVSQWLAGNREPDLRALLKLSRYFRVSLYDLTGLESLREIENIMARVRNKKLRLSERAIELAALYDRITDPSAKELIETLLLKAAEKIGASRNKGDGDST